MSNPEDEINNLRQTLRNIYSYMYLENTDQNSETEEILDIIPGLIEFNQYDLSRHNTIFRWLDQSNNLLNENNETTNNETTNIITRLLHSSFYDKPKYKEVLSEKGEEELKEIEYNSNLNTNSICPIFQTEFTENMQVILLPCNHIFSPEAIKKWLKREKAECPVCRYKLDSKEVENEDYIDPTLTINQRGRRLALYPGSFEAPPNNYILTFDLLNGYNIIPSQYQQIPTTQERELIQPIPTSETTEPSETTEQSETTEPSEPSETTELTNINRENRENRENRVNRVNRENRELEILEPYIRPRITTNLFADIISELIDRRQQEEQQQENREIQQAIINSLYYRAN